MVDFNIDKVMDKDTIRALCDYHDLTPEEKEKLKKDNVDEVRIELGRIYEEIKEVLSNYIDINEDYKELITLWIIGTYLHDSFETFPYLFLNAMRGSGKTRTLKLIARCCYEGQLLASLTESVLFRSTGTLAIDEFEGVGSKEKQALRELLNAGYKKGIKIRRMRKVKTLVGEEQKVEEFEAYRPIVMANIWGMDEVLGDRCIQLTLEKSNSIIHTKKIEDFTTNPQIKAIKEGMYYLKETKSVVKCVYVGKKNIYKEWNDYIHNKYTLHTHITLTTPNNTNIHKDILFNKIDNINIDGRHLELYFPFFIISSFLGEEVLDKTLKIAKRMIDDKKSEEIMESKDVMLFDFIDRVYEPNTWIKVNDLTKQFREHIGDSDDKAETWLNAQWMGRALKRLCLVREKRRLGKGMDVIIDKTKASSKMGIFR